jgi:hypothetical protein
VRHAGGVECAEREVVRNPGWNFRHAHPAPKRFENRMREERWGRVLDPGVDDRQERGSYSLGGRT